MDENSISSGKIGKRRSKNKDPNYQQMKESMAEQERSKALKNQEANTMDTLQIFSGARPLFKRPNDK